MNKLKVLIIDKKAPVVLDAEVINSNGVMKELCCSLIGTFTIVDKMIGNVHCFEHGGPYIVFNDGHEAIAKAKMKLWLEKECESRRKTIWWMEKALGRF